MWDVDRDACDGVGPAKEERVDSGEERIRGTCCIRGTCWRGTEEQRRGRGRVAAASPVDGALSQSSVVSHLHQALFQMRETVANKADRVCALQESVFSWGRKQIEKK